MIRKTTLSHVTALLIASVGAARAQVQPVGPFEGERFEGFESFGILFENEIDFFEGDVTVGSTFPGPAVFVLSQSNLGGVIVTPHTGNRLMGVGAAAIWDFHMPIERFGAYFATNNGFADATIDFFDTDLNLVATLEATVPGNDQSWAWNGWTFDVPIARIKVTGHNPSGGFIDYDDVTLTFGSPQPPGAAVPIGTPSAVVVLALVVLAGGFVGLRRRAAA